MMNPDIKKILHCTDLSEHARQSFAYAASIANRFGASITILHVLEDTSEYRDNLVINILGKEKWEEIRRQNEQETIERLKEEIQEFCREVSENMPACNFITDQIIVKIGNPVEEILKQVKATNCDLVVMGARGHGVLVDAVLGSVSRRVLRRCDKPILLVKHL